MKKPVLATAVLLAASTPRFAARRSSASAKKSTVTVDLSNVESSGGRIPEGDYLVAVSEAEIKTGKDSGEDYISLQFKVKDGEHKGFPLYHNCSLQPQALFNLRNVLEALKYEIPKKGALDLDVDELVDMECGVAVSHEKFEGKEKARITEFFPASELEEQKDEPKGKVKKDEEETTTRKKKKAPAFEEGDEVTFEDDDKNEQTGVIKSIDGDAATVVVGKGRKAEEWEIDVSELTKVE